MRAQRAEKVAIADEIAERYGEMEYRVVKLYNKGGNVRLSYLLVSFLFS